jgi:hypothetical protein
MEETPNVNGSRPIVAMVEGICIGVYLDWSRPPLLLETWPLLRRQRLNCRISSRCPGRFCKIKCLSGTAHKEDSETHQRLRETAEQRSRYDNVGQRNRKWGQSAADAISRARKTVTMSVVRARWPRWGQFPIERLTIKLICDRALTCLAGLFDRSPQAVPCR